MKRVFAAAVALGIAFAFAQSSSAQTEPVGSDLFVVPQRTVTPGGVAVVLKSQLSTCTGAVTSPGFVAPVEFTYQNADGSWIGVGEAVNASGSYTAKATCAGEVVERTFTVGATR
ncbi:hypothetical protein GCM10011609_20650 [Lentzea pudingi]|uniref:Ig-like domain-containing protein n=1 Tax=Lentzea pudingi TaxID=1789439 RepID=A0ABQ2HKL0_9PSEU|nr:hypothetical protein [Lentzea pudingi]GGM84406.1 hypothetical protein GCM10011609_20650 [Lentzea pudingi]